MIFKKASRALITLSLASVLTACGGYTSEQLAVREGPQAVHPVASLQTQKTPEASGCISAADTACQPIANDGSRPILD